MLATVSESADPAPKQRFALVFPLTDAQHHYVTGDIVPLDRLNTILFLQEPCGMPIEGADNMFRAWREQAAYQAGCWYATTHYDGYVYIDGQGIIRASQDVSPLLFPRAVILPDGSAKILEPNYDSDTFMRRQMEARMDARIRELQQHRNDAP
jgi:hypothetical protein